MYICTYMCTIVHVIHWICAQTWFISSNKNVFDLTLSFVHCTLYAYSGIYQLENVEVPLTKRHKLIGVGGYKIRALIEETGKS